MKKIFVYRLIAIMFLCISSLLIKSENTVYNIRCTSSISKPAATQETLVNDIKESPLHPNDGFFIKI